MEKKCIVSVGYALIRRATDGEFDSKAIKFCSERDSNNCAGCVIVADGIISDTSLVSATERTEDFVENLKEAMIFHVPDETRNEGFCSMTFLKDKGGIKINEKFFINSVPHPEAAEDVLQS